MSVLTAEPENEIVVYLVNDRELLTQEVHFSERWVRFKVGRMDWGVPITSLVGVVQQPRSIRGSMATHDGRHGESCMVCYPGASA